jgi:uncharacterized protein YjaG (DUF416 family)
MKNEGLKLTYKFGEIEGVRHSIKFEINDLVWVYYISEYYREKNKHIKYDSYLAKIIEIIPSSDGLHFEQYGVECIKTGGSNYWYYPTFLEPYKK